MNLDSCGQSGALEDTISTTVSPPLTRKDFNVLRVPDFSLHGR